MVETRSMKRLECSHKQGNIGISKDRLSELPDEVLINILSFLPTQCAVRTMVLRRFGSLWTLVPKRQFFSSHNLEYISNVMKYHKSPTIYGWEYYGAQFDRIEEVTKLVSVALRKKPKVFTLYFKNLDVPVSALRHAIFTSQSIESLTIASLCMDLPLRVDMISLRKLDLTRVKLVDDVLKVLEAGCPCLQELVLFHVYGLQKVHFTGSSIERLTLFLGGDNRVYSLYCPNLKFLLIRVNLDNLEVIDVSSVSHAEIQDLSLSIAQHFIILQNKFQNAKFFQLNYRYCCKQLEQCGNQKLAFKENEWSHLVLKSGSQGICLRGICRLLRKSRFLRELILYANADFFCNCNMLLQELSSPCKIGWLKVVTIHDFEKPCKTVVQLVRFLLKNAGVLDKLVIVCNKKDLLFSREGFEFVSGLLSLPRASQNARVVLA